MYINDDQTYSMLSTTEFYRLGSKTNMQIKYMISAHSGINMHSALLSLALIVEKGSRNESANPAERNTGTEICLYYHCKMRRAPMTLWQESETAT